MNPTEQYLYDRDEQIRKNMEDRDLRVYAERFTEELVRTNYTKNFTWAGVPIIQYPTDLMVIQEIIWKVKPDYIIETGTAFGGMTAFYASVLQGMGRRKGKVITIDIDFREHAIDMFMTHPLRNRIISIKGDSTSKVTKEMVKEFTWKGKILVSLDSNHTHSHVLQELRLYAPLVSVGSYIVAYDTAIEFYGHLDKNQDRPWGVGNNPWTAVQEFIKDNEEFVVDKEVEQRAGITAAPSGWLRRIK